jgi:spermidine/putrescine-binding protein
MAKLRAAGGRAELDVAYMDSQIVKQAKAEGLLQPLEPAKRTISTTPPATRTPTGSP